MTASSQRARPRAWGWIGDHARLLLAIAWLALTAVSAVALIDAHNRSRAEIEERVQLRTEMAARFAGSYIGDFFRQEQRTAVRELSAKTVARADLDRVAGLLGTPAAVLLDSHGDLLEIAPSNRGLIGSNLSRKYAHLEAATAGRPAVSDVVASAARGVPVVAFAVPFETAAGRRVFSGAFDVARTPFAAYLQRAVAVAPNRIYLVDSDNAIIATSAPGAPLPRLPAPPSSGPSDRVVTAFDSREAEYVTARAITGTPWRVVFAAPAATLYRPILGPQRWLPWLLWLGFAAGGLLCVVLVERLVRGRRQLDRLARVDDLTALPNRRATNEALHVALAAANRHRHHAAVLLVDVDRFKTINDDYGHAIGDEMLRRVADCLQAELRDDDMVGRWGGDEFLAVLAHTDPDGPAVLANRLHDRVKRTPLLLAGQPLPITISIGSAISQNETDPAALVLRADQAMYRAKREVRQLEHALQHTPAPTG